jgi:hypothetical protein
MVLSIFWMGNFFTFDRQDFMPEPAVLQNTDNAYCADSCEPLEAAARRAERHGRGRARGN